MSRKQSGEREKWLLAAALAMLIAVLILLVGQAGNAILKKRAEQSMSGAAVADNGTTITVSGKSYQPKKYLKTYLIMGIDKAEASSSMTNLNSQQTDFNALVIADMETESYSILYLNRDTMTDIPVLALDGTPYTTRYQQLALAHTYGTGMEDSCENTVSAVSSLLGGVTIDHYAACYLGSIGVLNDSVSGVTVTIEDDFSENDSTLVMGETVTLNAEQAEHYVRSRMDVADGTNLNRMKRQMTYLTAWTERVSEKISEDAGFAMTLAEQMGKYTVADLTVQQISDLADVLNGYEQTGTYQLEGEAVQGEMYMEFYVDEDALQQTILKLFYKEIDE